MSELRENEEGPISVEICREIVKELESLLGGTISLTITVRSLISANISIGVALVMSLMSLTMTIFQLSGLLNIPSFIESLPTIITGVGVLYILLVFGMLGMLIREQTRETRIYTYLIREILTKRKEILDKCKRIPSKGIVDELLLHDVNKLLDAIRKLEKQK